MARSKKNLAIDLIFLSSKIPWWVSVPLATASYFLLHSVAENTASIEPSIHFGSIIRNSIGHALAYVGQYFLPLCLGIGALLSLHKSRTANKLADSISSGVNTLNGMSWREFEVLVGQAFRRQGFTVSETSEGADGGVDLVLRRDGELHLVQCKQWRATRVSVMVVRELFGVMAASGAIGGFVVTSGRFTSEAKAFAQGRNVVLVEGPELESWITESRATPIESVPSKPVNLGSEDTVATVPTVVACPLCRSSMVARVARKGKKAGSHFWGCSQYPICKGIVNL
jgi:restriction system protein